MLYVKDGSNEKFKVFVMFFIILVEKRIRFHFDVYAFQDPPLWSSSISDFPF
jgi:hypothetical protein